MSELTIGFSASASKQEQLNELMRQIMGCYSVSDDEGPLTDAVEVFLKKQPHLTVRRHGDTLVASTDFGRERRVILAGHLDTVPVIDNFPPKWLQPGDPLIREDVAAGHEHERVIWGRGATDMKGSDAVMLYLAATLTDAKYDLTYVFYDHEEVAAEKNGLRKVVESHPDWITGRFRDHRRADRLRHRGRLQRHDAIRRDHARRCRAFGPAPGWARMRSTRRPRF